MIIVDSSVWIDFLKGETNPETQWLDLRLDHDPIALTTMILAEVLQGLRNDREASTVESELRKFQIVELHDIALAVEAAAHHRLLRQQGRTVRSTIDLLIATYCIREEHQLLHRDRDFDLFEQHLGLQVIRP